MKNVYLLGLSFFLTNVIIAQSKDETAVRAILATQQNAWNRGDVTTFMVGYWENDSLLYVGKNGPKYGYKNALANYKKNYPDTATMGKLKFDLVQVKPLGKGYYFVLGKWFLNRSIGDIGGMFTLLFKKINGQWKIIADHSS